MTGKSSSKLRQGPSMIKRPMYCSLFTLQRSVTRTRPAGLQTGFAAESEKCGGLYTRSCSAPLLRRLARSAPRQRGGAMAQLELVCVAAWASCPELESEIPAAVLRWHLMSGHRQRRSQAPHAVSGDHALTVCACSANTRHPDFRYRESQLRQQQTAVEPLPTRRHPPEQHS